MTWRLDTPRDAQCFDTEAEALAAQTAIDGVSVVWEMGDVATDDTPDAPGTASKTGLALGYVRALVGRQNDERRSA